MTLPNFLDDLNPQQRQAVESLSGPVLVLAGPGSGKTRVLTYRVAYLARVCGVSPHRIVAVTFTNKAAREMRERLQGLLGSEQALRLTMGTFHSICARILRRDGQPLGLDREFLIYDSDDQVGLVKQAMQELRLDEKQYAPKSVLYSISRAKDELQTPQDYARVTSSYWEEIVARVYKVYQRLLRENRALDFDDLIFETVRLFEEHPPVRQHYQQRYQHVLVDEYQDTNHAQYALVHHLAGGYRNLFVVGDEEQAIYAWRGATLRNIVEFEQDYPDARVILLEQNYRSTQRILEGARAVIGASSQRPYEKKLWTENTQGAPIIVREAYDEREEALLVAQQINHLLEHGYSPGDVAIMYRTNAQSRAFEEVFLRYGLRYKLIGGTRFYQRREVRDILAYLRLIYNPLDSVSLLRIVNVPPRQIGARTVAQWREWAGELGQPLYTALERLGTPDQPLPEELPMGTRAANALGNFYALMEEFIGLAAERPLPELLKGLLEGLDYRDYLLRDRERGQERWENVQELLTVTQDYTGLPPREALAAFLEETALIADVDELDEQSESITLITLHQAKGLEFPVVFIVGLEEGLLPHARSMADPDELEEERRLCYVGMTRAEEQLFLLRAFKRTIFGNSSARTASRFLNSLDPEMTSSRLPSQQAARRFERPSDSSDSPGRRKWTLRRPNGPPASTQTPEPVTVFQPGDHVRHPHFGEGVVISVQKDRSDQQLSVAFEGQGVKRLMASLAHLEKI
ncbi:MAG: UvrD-helicase domain-containing protein [Chloroflexia bacterium]|nr:UvrD-helicase domain-containing protein [Chloroflexia bacterium]